MSQVDDVLIELVCLGVWNSAPWGEAMASEQPVSGQRGRDLLPFLYDELRRLAAARLAGENPGQTLQPTALVHEAYLRIVGSEDPARWANDAHFFAAASEAMRRILVENARRKRTLKRGGDRCIVGSDRLQELPDATLRDKVAVESLAEKEMDVLALDGALQKLHEVDSQKAQLVQMRYFGGLTLEQAALALGISRATADRYWAFSKAWLLREIRDTP
ncbi:MAG: ECF-type sigma factor [Pirellulales bacterium]